MKKLYGFSLFNTRKFFKSSTEMPFTEVLGKSSIQENSIINHKLSEKLKEIPKLSDFLVDNYNRMHNYLRISLTEKCNLRCQVKNVFNSSIACLKRELILLQMINY